MRGSIAVDGKTSDASISSDRSAPFVCASATFSSATVPGSMPLAVPSLISRARALRSSASVPSLATRMCFYMRATARSKLSVSVCCQVVRAGCSFVAVRAEDVCMVDPAARIANANVAITVIDRFTLCLLTLVVPMGSFSDKPRRFCSISLKLPCAPWKTLVDSSKAKYRIRRLLYGSGASASVRPPRLTSSVASKQIATFPTAQSAPSAKGTHTSFTTVSVSSFATRPDGLQVAIYRREALIVFGSWYPTSKRFRSGRPRRTPARRPGSPVWPTSGSSC